MRAFCCSPKRKWIRQLQTNISMRHHLLLRQIQVKQLSHMPQCSVTASSDTAGERYFHHKHMRFAWESFEITFGAYQTIIAEFIVHLFEFEEVSCPK